jgi:hypothetical protein
VLPTEVQSDETDDNATLLLQLDQMKKLLEKNGIPTANLESLHKDFINLMSTTKKQTKIHDLFRE